MGPWAALAVSLALFGAIAWITTVAERKRHGQLVDETKPARGPRWLSGPWPLVAGAIGLAVVNIATLTIGGRPWGVTSAFALWGAKWFAALGIDVASWPYWTAPAQAAALKSSVLMDVTSVMDFGIILGALLAAMLAGRFAPVWKISGPLARRGGDRRPAARLRRAHRLRLQHRRLLQRHRLGQPARLAVAGRRVRRQHRRHAACGRCST